MSSHRQPISPVCRKEAKTIFHQEKTKDDMESSAEKSGNYSTHMKSIQCEHDYCINPLVHDNNNNKDSEGNVFGKKFHSDFDAVNKWADSVILRLPTGDDWKKNVDREITILKVKYPFLPEQQIRGKVYKKFGIPAIMGGVLSRGISLIGGSTPKERSKSRRRDTKKKDSKKTVKILEIFNDDELVQQETIFSNESKSTYEDKTSSTVNNEDSSSISIDSDPIQLGTLSHEFSDSRQYTSPLIMDEFSIECETTQSLTPDIQFQNTRRVTSPVISGKTLKNPEFTQSLTQDFQLSNSALISSNSLSGTISIHSQLTQVLTPDFPTSNNQLVSSPSLPDTVSINSGFIKYLTPSDIIRDLRAESSTDSNVTFMSNLELSKKAQKISHDELPTQKISLGELPTQKNMPLMYETNLIESSKKHVHRKDLNENLLKKVQSSTKPRERKKKCYRGILSTNLSTSSTSLVINDMQLFRTDDDKSYEEIQSQNSPIKHATISIGTKIPMPVLLRGNTPDIVILDHSYSGKEKKPSLITLESDDSDIENDRSINVRNKQPAETASKKLSGKNVTINNNENRSWKKKMNSYKKREETIVNCEARKEHFNGKENETAKKRVRHTRPEMNMLQNNRNETSRFDDNIAPMTKKPNLFLEDDSESIQSVEITSPARKKRRVYYRNSKSISPDVKTIKKKCQSISAQSRHENATPEIIDVSDDVENATITESPIAIIGDNQTTMLGAKFITCLGDLPLFIVVDSLSNHCCEYDQDLSKIARLTEYANNFDHDLGKRLRDSLNVTWQELKEKIETLTKILEIDCRD